MKQELEKYIRGVVSGEIVSCEFVQQAIGRHISDLERTDIYFDEKAAARAVLFFSFLKHYKGSFAGKNSSFSHFRFLLLLQYLAGKKWTVGGGLIRR